MDEQSNARSSEPMPAISRRTFVSLVLGAVGSLLAACRGTTVAPSATVLPTFVAEASPTETQLLSTATPVPPTDAATPSPPTHTPTAPPPTYTLTAPPDPVTSTSTSVPSNTPLPPTYTPVPPTATKPPPPTVTPTMPPADPPALSRAALMAHWPATGTSRVVLVRHSGVWAGGSPDPAIVLQMLDDGLRTLADVGDVMSIWHTLFDPGERVLLKVNCIARGGPTQPAVTYAVAQRLQDAGLAAENILIFDRKDHELRAAGYTLNDGGPGVQCHGPQGQGTKITLSKADLRFFQEFDACGAIINLPTPKQHGGAGISASLKNHYGSVDQPNALHDHLCDPGIAELNAQPNVRDKTRLIVGAALKISPDNWDQPERGDALLLSFDPVALDTVARDVLVRHRQAKGLDAAFLVERAIHLKTSQSLNLGATDVNLIDLREVTLG